MMTINQLREIIRQETPVRFELGTVVSADPSGTRDATIRLSGGRTTSRVYMMVDDLKVGDKVLIAHVEGVDRVVVIGRILSQREAKLSKHGILAPPDDLTITGYPDSVKAQWSVYPGEDLCYQLQEAPTDTDTEQQDEDEISTMFVTRGGEYTHLCTVESDMGPERWWFRVRAIRWIDDNNVMYSAWSGWDHATSITWDDRYYKETELSSDTHGEGASLIWIEDAAANFDTASNVEEALAELAVSASEVIEHDHSDADNGGAELYPDVVGVNEDDAQAAVHVRSASATALAFIAEGYSPSVSQVSDVARMGAVSYGNYMAIEHDGSIRMEGSAVIYGAGLSAASVTPAKLTGLGDVIFTSDNGLLVLGLGCPITPTSWTSLRGQVATISGAFHQEQGRWPGAWGLVVELATTNYELAPRMIEDGATGLAAGWTYTDSLGSGGNATLDVVAHPILERGWLQRATYTAAAGDTDDNVSIYDATSASSFAQDDYFTISMDVKGILSGASVQIIVREFDSGAAGGTTHSSDAFDVTESLQRIAHTAQCVDADCDYLRVLFRVSGIDDGDSFDVWFGAVNVEKTQYATSFCCGALPWCVWDGADDDGTSSRTKTQIQLDDHAPLLNTDSFAVSMWFKAPWGNSDWGLGSGSYLFQAEEDANNRCYINIKSDGDILINFEESGTSAELTETCSFDADEWVFVLVNYDTTGDMELFVQGVLVNSIDLSSRSTISPTDMNFGSSVGGNYQPCVTISDPAIYGRTLTSAEVASLYHRNMALVDCGAIMPPTMDGRLLRVPVSSDNVSSPPTDSEITSAFGTPSDGFAGVIDDNGAGSDVWLVRRASGAWWYQALTKAV